MEMWIVVLLCMPLISITNAFAARGPKFQPLYFYWFRLQDLRLQDNIGFHRSCAASRGQVVPIVCLEQQFFDERCSPRRAKFILESIQDLRKQLKDRGSGLLVAKGNMEEVMDNMLESIKCGENSLAPIVYCQTDLSETNQSFETLLKRHHHHSALRSVWGATLFREEDLYHADTTSFATFQASLENTQIDTPQNDESFDILRLPAVMNDIYEGRTLPQCSLSYLPSLRELGYTDIEIDSSKVPLPSDSLFVRGGEIEGRERLDDLVARDLLPNLKLTRNAMMGKDSSSRLSPWIAHGCLSPRQVANVCKDTPLINELKRRDYFMMRERHFDTKDGVPRVPGKLVAAWKSGRTGFPIIDACMRELAVTGVLSSRGRKLVASFWIHQLQLDWRVGAIYLESALLDCNPSSNWGNWRDLAHSSRTWDIMEESLQWDPDGTYIKRWIPELREISGHLLHQPWKLTLSQKARYAMLLGYPQPIVQNRMGVIHPVR